MRKKEREKGKFGLFIWNRIKKVEGHRETVTW
jgi:hypothetical protein